jgi:hypothetical protein
MIEEKIKLLLAKYCPNFCEIMLDRRTIWIELSKKFNDKLVDSEVKITKDGFVVTENSIPILLGKADSGDKISIDFLNFVDLEIRDLYDSVSNDLKNSVKKVLDRLLLEFDIKELPKPNPTYLNGLSEIFTINKLIKSGTYTLDSIEIKLPNNKTADFRLLNDSNTYVYVEIYNIHIDSSKVTDFLNFKIFVDKRINDKISDKTTGLDNQIRESFFLFPIIWADDSITDYLNEYTEKFDLSISNVLPPCSLVQFDYDGKKGFYFGTI